MNTLYFDCRWKNKEIIDEVTQPFYGQKSEKEVSFFGKKAVGDYHESTKYELFSDEFVGGNKIFYVLPKENIPVDEIISTEIMTEISTKLSEKLRSLNLNYYISSLDVTTNIDYMPFFTNQQFDINKNGFTKMIDEELFQVNNIIQQTRFILNKEGVKATSNTRVDLFGTVPPDKEIILNRPFLYFITDSDSIPLFVRITKNL